MLNRIPTNEGLPPDDPSIDPLITVLKNEILILQQKALSQFDADLIEPPNVPSRLITNHSDFSFFRPVPYIVTVEVQITRPKRELVKVSAIDHYAYYVNRRFRVSDPKFLDWFKAIIRTIFRYGLSESITPGTMKLDQIIDNFVY